MTFESFDSSFLRNIPGLVKSSVTREVFRESDKTGSIGVYKGCVGLGQPYLIQTISADICVCQVNRRATKYLFGNELTARKIHSYHSAICIFESII